MPAWPKPATGNSDTWNSCRCSAKTRSPAAKPPPWPGESAAPASNNTATFEDFDFTVSPKLPAAMLRDLAALRWLDAGESVILYGPVGVGKTHVAQALGHQVARRGGDIRFVKCSRMLADLAGGHADRTIGQRMREYTRPLVLIVDDFAMREHTPTQSDDLYDLVSDRAIAAKPLILTSNRAPKDWYPLFPNPVVAESLLDRLINTSHQILMDGPSYRPRKRPGTATT